MAKAKDKRDLYYRLAKEEGWRARSAYKLMHIDDKYHILRDVKRVVDLCAAPGSWSQVLASRLCKNSSENVKIIAVDLQAMAPIHGVTQIQGDITKLSTAEAITSHFGEEKADLVVCDGAPDVTGVHELDEQNQSYLLVAALSITTHVLKPGGTFVAKIFRAGDTTLLRSQLQIFFKGLFIEKPPSSRDSSVESFVICRDYSPPKGYIPQMINPMVDDIQTLLDATDSEVNHEIIPFIFCGDLRNMKSELLSCRDNEKTGLPEFSYNSVVEPYCVVDFKEMREPFDECVKRLPFKPTIENLIYYGNQNYKKYLEHRKTPRKVKQEESDPILEDGIFAKKHEQKKSIEESGEHSSSADHQLLSDTEAESNMLHDLVPDLNAL